MHHYQTEQLAGVVSRRIFESNRFGNLMKSEQGGYFGAIIVTRSSVRFSGFEGGCMPDTTWQALYRAALAESDPRKLNGRIAAARYSIHQRLEQLEQIEDSRDTRERQQLNDALYALETLPARKRSA